MRLFSKNSSSDRSDNSIDKEFVSKIKKGDTKAFEELFFEYHHPLNKFAYSILSCKDEAGDVVQEVFLRIWQRRKKLDISTSIKLYLYQAVRNQAYNQISKRDKRRKIANILEFEQKPKQYDYDFYLNLDESIRISAQQQENEYLIKKIWELVRKMPEKRRLVFELHRQHGLSYNEIATIMSITTKTVENHMGLAFQELRNNINVKECNRDWGVRINSLS